VIIIFVISIQDSQLPILSLLNSCF